MDPSNEQDTHIFEWLFGMLVAAIAGLAGIVWRASGASTRLEIIDARVKLAEERQTAHEATRAHIGTAAELEAMRREIDELRNRHVNDLVEIRAEISDLRNHRG